RYPASPPASQDTAKFRITDSHYSTRSEAKITPEPWRRRTLHNSPFQLFSILAFSKTPLIDSIAG
ncbi:MAG: hypothetical protein JJT75_00115, partial [Opitutales bacterium]|nr:hypothetical protein [Opitutales bacterium]